MTAIQPGIKLMDLVKYLQMPLFTVTIYTVCCRYVWDAEVSRQYGLVYLKFLFLLLAYTE